MHPKRSENPNAKRPKLKNRELDAMVKVAWDEGWWCRRTGSGHVQCYPPNDDKSVTVPGTPSDHHSVKNTRKFFRLRGLTL